MVKNNKKTDVIIALVLVWFVSILTGLAIYDFFSNSNTQSVVLVAVSSVCFFATYLHVQRCHNTIKKVLFPFRKN